jgi:hypothetical protein
MEEDVFYGYSHKTRNSSGDDSRKMEDCCLAQQKGEVMFKEEAFSRSLVVPNSVADRQGTVISSSDAR